MTLEEAIKYNEEVREGIDVDEMPKHHAAVQLGVEALKRIKRLSPNRALPFTELLPGETEEKVWANE